MACRHIWAKVAGKNEEQGKKCGYWQGIPEETEKIEYLSVEQEGLKFDKGKSRPDLLPPHAIEAISRVLAYGAKKYTPNNWRKVEDGQTRYLSAGLRHILAFMRGERNDSESGEHHMAHAACCLLFVLELNVDE